MDISKAIFSFVLISLLLVACRAPYAPAGEQAQPIPYTAVAVPQTAATPQPIGNRPVTDAELLQMGAAIYTTNCAPCHQPNGEGNLEIFPALNRNAFVTLRAPEPVIDTVLHGREVMPAFAPTLNDVEVAATLSYIRNAWGNSASMINAEQVGEVRAAASEE